MHQDNPKVQVKSQTPFGVSYSELDTDHNQRFGTPSDWAYSLLQRLAFSPRLEVFVADTLLWVSTSSLVTSLAIVSVNLGVPAYIPVWLTVVLLIPVCFWAKWIDAHVDPVFREITGLRLMFVLLGVAIALLFGYWL